MTDTEIPDASIRIELLGRFVARAGADGAPVKIRSRRGRALLAYLSLYRGQTIPRARLAALLWEDHSETSARHNLRQVLTELRERIGPALEEGVGKESLGLPEKRFVSDVSEFLALAGTPSLAALKAATALYAGDLTDDFEPVSQQFDEIISVERRKLHALALNTFDSCVRALEAEGLKRDALQICERLLALDPLREATHQLLIPLEHAVNGRSSALSRANILATELREQLGIPPERATQELIEALKAEDAENATKPATLPPPQVAKVRSWPRQLAIAGVAALSLFAVASGFLLSQRADTEVVDPSDQRAYSVAVLPFSAQNSDELNRFLRVLERNITDTLSLMPRFFTISQQTMRIYRNSAKDAREIGRELKVNYLLTGDAYTEDEETVLRVRLIDAKTGTQLWSNRYTHRLGQKENILEEVAISLGHQFRMKVVASEGLRKERLDREDPTYDDYLERGFAELYQPAGSRNYPAALELFEKALAIQPRSATAKVAIARILTMRVFEHRSPDPAFDLKRADELLTSALRAAPRSAPAHFNLGVVRKLQGRHPEAVPLFEKALKINPSHVNAYVQLGHSLIFIGRAGETERYVEKAIRLGPFDRGSPYWNIFAGEADLHLEHFDKAIARFNTAVRMNPNLAPAHYLITAAYYLKNDHKNAVAAAKELKRRFPKFDPERIISHDYNHPGYTPQHMKQVDAIRKALALADASASTH